MVLFGGPRDHIGNRVICVFPFGVIKLYLFCLVSCLCSMYWNLVWKLSGMVSLCTLIMKYRTWCKLSLYTSLAQVITLVSEWIKRYGLHHRRIFRSSYRKLAWVGFEPGHEFNSFSEPTLYSYSNFIVFFSIPISFRSLPSSVATLALSDVWRK